MACVFLQRTTMGYDIIDRWVNANCPPTVDPLGRHSECCCAMLARCLGRGADTAVYRRSLCFNVRFLFVFW